MICRYWLRSPDPSVDQRLFAIAVKGQQAVARRLQTRFQTRAMHAMASSAGGHGAQPAPPPTGSANLTLDEPVSSSSCGAREGASGASAAAQVAAAQAASGDADDSHSAGGVPEVVDGVAAIANATAVLIRAGHSDALFAVQNLVETWVRSRWWVCVTSCLVLAGWHSGACALPFPNLATLPARAEGPA